MCSAVALGIMLAAHCGTEPEPEVMVFTLNGARYSTSWQDGHARPPEFELRGLDPAFGGLGLTIHRFVESADGRTFMVEPFDSTATAGLTTPQGLIYSTLSYGGGGRIAVAVRNCHRGEVIDPEAGKPATAEFCTLSGTFEFSAKSEAGDSILIKDGRFLTTFFR